MRAVISRGRDCPVSWAEIEASEDAGSGKVRNDGMLMSQGVLHSS